MKFTPRSDEELSKAFPKGEYPFEVVGAVDKTSKSGNDMIELNLAIYHPNGKQARVFDYLLEVMEFKLKHFCQAVGLLHLYEKGTFGADDAFGRSGKCIIDIQPAKDGYPEKNIVKDYVKLPEDKQSEVINPNSTKAPSASSVPIDPRDIVKIVGTILKAEVKKNTNGSFYYGIIVTKEGNQAATYNQAEFDELEKHVDCKLEIDCTKTPKGNLQIVKWILVSGEPLPF